MLYGVMVEGTAELAIFNILLENNYLFFEKEDIIENSNGDLVYSKINGKKYISDFLDKSFDECVTMIIVMDNPKININFSKTKQIEKVCKYITREEIEAIQLYAKNNWLKLYERYKSKNKKGSPKPSEFFKDSTKNGGLGIKNIKKYDYVYNLWSSKPEQLVKAIIKVKQSMLRKNALKGYDSREFFYLADILNDQVSNRKYLN